MVTRRPDSFEVTLGDLLGALQDAFLDELEDEELAALAVEAIVEEHLLDGTWSLEPEVALP